jgi:hypothetical protein
MGQSPVYNISVGYISCQECPPQHFKPSEGERQRAGRLLRTEMHAFTPPVCSGAHAGNGPCLRCPPYSTSDDERVVCRCDEGLYMAPDQLVRPQRVLSDLRISTLTSTPACA